MVLTAIAVAHLVPGVLGPLLDVELVVRSGEGTREVTPLAISVSTIVIGLLGWGLLELLERRFGRRGRSTWRVLAAAVLAISLLGPAGATTTAGMLGLGTLHLAVGGILLLGLPRSRPGRCRCT